MDDRQHGQGKYHWPNGQFYDGEWRSSQFQVRLLLMPLLLFLLRLLLLLLLPPLPALACVFFCGKIIVTRRRGGEHSRIPMVCA